MWPESSSVSDVNLVEKSATVVFYWRTCVLVLVQLSVTVVTEQSAYQMASQMTVDRTNAIHKILDDVYAHNRDNSDAVSSICTLFTELSHYGYLHILLFILT